MRIGIDYRILSSVVYGVYRGVGRYTQQQLREVLKLSFENEFVLFCRPDTDVSLILPEIRSAPNVSISYIEMSEDRVKGNPNEPAKSLRYAEEYQEWIYRQHVDIYHATVPFWLNDTVLTHFDVCPMVINFYDIIPLIFPNYYLPPNTVETDLYIRTLSFILRAERLIAISESARRDALHYLGFPADHIDLAYPIADPWFQVLPRESVQSTLTKLRVRIQVPDSYVMSVPGLHYSKNFETLLAAYASLSPSLRRDLPLVLVFAVTDSERDYLRVMTDKLEITRDVILTGFVTEDELVALYNQATMLLHPSRYEGFGLPVLEALQCGTPVITTTSSSLPEVGGDAAILINPGDTQGFANAMEALYADSAHRDMMKQRGLEHAKKYTPTQLGQNTLDSYSRAGQACLQKASSSDRLRIALWTPLPPQESGIADYSAELLQGLARECDIEVFVDDGYLPSPELLSRYVIQHYSSFDRRQTQKAFDVIVYQVGASFFHLYMYESIQKRPGMVVLHDLIWGTVLYYYYRNANKLDEFKKEIVALEGRAALQEFEREFEHIRRRPSQLDGYDQELESFLNTHYMLKKIVNSSRALVVHDDLLRDDLEAKYKTRSVYTVHPGVEDPWHGLPILKSQIVRTRLGLESAAFVVGVFGFVHQVKRLEVCLKAFCRLRDEHPEARLFIVGRYTNDYKRTLDDLAKALGVDQYVYFTDRVSKTDFQQFLLVCDVVVNLRYPSHKQISATMMRAIAAGKPVITTDLPEWALIPGDFCWRVSPDENEVTNLAKDLIRLADDPALKQQMSWSARAYFEREGAVEQMAARYRSLIEQIAGKPVVAPHHDPRKDAQLMPTLAFNKVCELEDFDDPELIETIRDVFKHEIRKFTPEFPKGAEYRKYWEIAMSIRALRHFGTLRPDSVVLGVGAGTETTLFYLTNHIKQVFATDLYLDSGMWGKFAPGFMLFEPDKVAPYEFDRNRLVVQHMDGRVLRYPDSTFDGIFSSSSIEHFGSFEFVGNAIYEMGRVLKPGGVLTLSTEFIVSGPPGEIGWEGITLFSRENLQRYIVEASGLELVDELQTDLSNQTLASQRDLSMYGSEMAAQVAEGKYPRAGEIVWSNYPHLLLVHAGYVFGSIHLTLRKTESYPTTPNFWAKPTEATLAAVENASPSSTSTYIMPTPAETASRPQPPAQQDNSETMISLREQFEIWEETRIGGLHKKVSRLPKGLNSLGHLLARVFQLGRSQLIQKRLYQVLIDQLVSLETQIQLNNASQTRLIQEQIGEQARLKASLVEINRWLPKLDVHMQSVQKQIASQAQSYARQDETNARLDQLDSQIQKTQQQIASQGHPPSANIG